MARARLWALAMRRAGAAWGLASLPLAACSGDMVNLGTSGALVGDAEAGAGGSAAGGTSGAPSWQAPHLVFRQPDPETPHSLANGTFTADGTEVYLTRQKRGEPISVACRAELQDDTWSVPQPLRFLGVELDDVSSPAISLDGSELWLGSRQGGASSTEIWLSRGDGETWSMPERVDALNSEYDDAPRQPGLGGTVMPLSSKRGSQHYQVWLALRAAAGEPWQAPSQAGLDLVNSPDHESADAFLSHDGLTLLFASARSGGGDLYRAERASVDDAFGEPVALGGVNHEGSDERDPWLDERNGVLYFSSNRSGLYETYRAEPAP